MGQEYNYGTFLNTWLGLLGGGVFPIIWLGVSRGRNTAGYFPNLGWGYFGLLETRQPTLGQGYVVVLQKHLTVHSVCYLDSTYGKYMFYVMLSSINIINVLQINST